MIGANCYERKKESYYIFCHAHESVGVSYLYCTIIYRREQFDRSRCLKASQQGLPVVFGTGRNWVKDVYLPGRIRCSCLLLPQEVSEAHRNSSPKLGFYSLASPTVDTPDCEREPSESYALSSFFSFFCFR